MSAFIISKPSEPVKSISLSKVLASVPSVVPEDCGLRAVVMLLTGLPENSATVFVTMSLTESASIEAELYVQFALKRKTLLLVLSEHASSVSS